MVAWDGVTLEALDAVDVEQMRAGKEVNWFAPECHQADCTLILLSIETFVLYLLPVVLVFMLLSFGNSKFLQISLYLVLALQFVSLNGYHFIHDILF